MGRDEKVEWGWTLADEMGEVSKRGRHRRDELGCSWEGFGLIDRRWV